MSNVTLTGDQFILFALLLKIAIMAGLATVLVSSAKFKRHLLAEESDLARDMRVSLLLAVFFSFGVAVRILIGYGAADLSLPGVYLIGLLTGPGPGAVAGVIIALPASLFGEFLTLPLFVLCGTAAGMVRRLIADREIIWSFSPLPFVNIYHYIKSAVMARRIEGQLLIFISCLGFDIFHNVLSGRYDRFVFDLHPHNFGVLVCMFLATLSCVGIPLKIWNNTRLEKRLEQRELRLVEARYQALKNQINPHFLFNTLNSISSCLWNEPQKARWILLKLSEILRRLLRSESDFTPLSRELEFIDSYLQIETIRFGEEKLKVKKNIDPRVLDTPVPGMIIQPFIENALKHGIAPLLHGGVLEISAHKNGEATVVEIRDNGSGIDESFMSRGIGIENVMERLEMLYGPGRWCVIEKPPGGGTVVRLEFPYQVSSGLEAGQWGK